MRLSPLRKIYSYQQLEFSDCGQTCIKILCRYYGKKISHIFFNKISDISRLGMSATDISNTLKKSRI